MKRIYKYGVTTAPIPMPVGAQILSAGLQDGAIEDQVYVWAVVDPTAPLEPRCVTYYFTNGDIPEPFTFIGTLQCKNGFVYHVVELLKEVEAATK